MSPIAKYTTTDCKYMKEISRRIVIVRFVNRDTREVVSESENWYICYYSKESDEIFRVLETKNLFYLQGVYDYKVYDLLVI